MLLSDRDLRAEIRAGELGLEPFESSLVQPSSIDVRRGCRPRLRFRTGRRRWARVTWGSAGRQRPDRGRTSEPGLPVVASDFR